VIESIPNLSEGRDRASIDRIVGVVRQAGGRVLDVHVDPDHHRSVLTIVGPPIVAVESVLSMVEIAIGAIDMRRHRGAHPRMGAVDVIPFVPLAGSTLDECTQIARAAGREIAERFSVPVYLYEAAAMRPERENLADVRRGGLAAVAERARTDAGRPDFGPDRIDPAIGAIAVGARRPLVAFNVNLATSDLHVAKAIASVVRASAGGLPGVKALGIPLRSRGLVQVSMNLTDVEATTVPAAFARVTKESARRGVEVFESEIVGLVPRAAVAGASAEDLLLSRDLSEMILEARLESR